MKRILQFFAASALLAFPTASTAQWIGGNAYMIGDYVEVGIDSIGYEGTDSLPGSNNRGPAYNPDTYFGFVANPAMDGWVEYNGDFFTPGSPENGWGITIPGVANYANNGMGLEWDPADTNVVGEITDYYETPDSVIVTWEGSTPELNVAIQYSMQKDQMYYTTTIYLENTTGSALDSVAFYRNIDPDHNQLIGWGFVTENTIDDQVDVGGIARVTATQTNTWTAEYILEAEGGNWRAGYMGFVNRDGIAMWNGDDPYVQEVDSTYACDCGIFLSYLIESMPPGKASGESFSFISRFSSSVSGLDIKEEAQAILNVYPNPTSDVVNIEMDGDFLFIISDSRGRIISNGTGSNSVQVDLSNEPAGNYFVKVRQKGKFMNRTIVIQ